MPGEIFRELGLFMGLASVVLLSPLILLGLAIPYAILHQRNAREVERDPQLGLKAALYFFYSVSILLFLTGLSIIIVDLMRDAELLGVNAGFRRGAPGTFTGEKRTGAALMFAGFTFGLAHFIVIQMATNDRRWPRTRRVFGGWRMAMSGMVVLLMFTALVVQLFQEAIQADAIQDSLAVLIIWTPAWLVDLVLLRSRSRQSAVDDEPERERLRSRVQED